MIMAARFWDWCKRTSGAGSSGRGAICLALHRVQPDPGEAWTATHRLTVTPQWFEDLAADIAANHDPVSLDAIAAHLEAGEPLPPQAVAITFDDGYRDLADYVLPILQRYELPATAFVSSTLASHEAVPFEFALERIIRKRTRLNNEGRSWTLDNVEAKRMCFNALSRALRPQPRQIQLQTLASLNDGDAEVPAPGDLLLNWRELAQLRESGLFSLAAHGHEHRPLNQRPIGEAESDLWRCLDLFQQNLGFEPTLLAFPYGATSSAVGQLVRRMGLRAAFTTVKSDINRDTDRFAIPRYELGAEHLRQPAQDCPVTRRPLPCSPHAIQGTT